MQNVSENQTELELGWRAHLAAELPTEQAEALERVSVEHVTGPMELFEFMLEFKMQLIKVVHGEAARGRVAKRVARSLRKYQERNGLWSIRAKDAEAVFRTTLGLDFDEPLEGHFPSSRIRSNWVSLGLERESNKLWPRVNWRDRESTLQAVKERVSYHLKLGPCSKGSAKWHAQRRSLCELSYREFVCFGLERAVRENKFFNSHVVIIMELFGKHYDLEGMTIRESLNDKAAVERGRHVIAEHFALCYGHLKGSEDWLRERAVVLSLSQPKLRKIGLEKFFAGRSPLFKSHLDFLIAMFDEEYDVADEFNARRKK